VPAGLAFVVAEPAMQAIFDNEIRAAGARACHKDFQIPHQSGPVSPCYGALFDVAMCTNQAHWIRSA
jgi:hypothetical protein